MTRFRSEADEAYAAKVGEAVAAGAAVLWGESKPTIEQEFSEALRKSAALARSATFLGYKSATLPSEPSIWLQRTTVYDSAWQTKPMFFSVFWRPL